MDKNFVRSTCLFLVLASGVHAGAWVRAPGQGWIQALYSTYKADKFWDNFGNDLNNDGAYRKHEIRVYGEHGLGKTDSLIYNINDQWVHKDHFPPLDNSGAQDWELGDRHLIHKGKTTSDALELDLVIPMGYSATDILPLGLDAFGAVLRFAHGLSFKAGSNYGYAEGVVGYRFRGKSLSDQFEYQLSAGVPFGSAVQGILKLNGTDTLGGFASNFLTPSLIANSWNLVKLSEGIQVKVAKNLWSQTWHVGDLSGKATGDGEAWETGLVFAY